MSDKSHKLKSPKKQPTGDYPIGYAKPPEHAKWKPGQSGNPSGKPKTPPDPDRTFIKHAMNETMVKIGDQIEPMTNFDVILLALFQQVKKGDVKAIKIAMDKYKESYGYLQARKALEPEEKFSWDEEQEKLWKTLNEIEYGVKQDGNEKSEKVEDKEEEVEKDEDPNPKK